MKYLVDSNIIIYHLNGEEKATNFLIKNYKQIAISQITYVEVLSFPFTDKEEKSVKKLLKKFKILDINSSIAEIAIQNRKIKKIKLPDNLIASTAINYNLILVTNNVKDFKALNISIMDLF